MPTTTSFLGLTAYRSTTDASSVLIYTYNDQISGSGTTQNLGILDASASRVSASLIVISASMSGMSASIVQISASLANMTASPITAPYQDLMPQTSIPPLSGSSLYGAAFEYIETSSSATYKPIFAQLRFDDTSNEGRQWIFRVPTVTGSSCTVRISGRMASPNSSKNVILGVQLACTSVGDTSGSTKSFATATTATVTVPDAANTQFGVTIPIIYSDSLATADDCTLLLYRDAATDTASGDFIMTSGRIHFNV